MADVAFVTGATGFLGYALALALVEDGRHVRALTRSGSLPGELGERGVEPVKGDLSAQVALREAMKGTRWAFHVAADVNMWRHRWADSVKSNVDGTRNIAEASLAAGVERLVYTSSAATIGKGPARGATTEPVTVDETTTYDLGHHQMVYPHTKWLGERAVHDAIVRGLDAVITHPTVILGPWDWKGNLLPMFTTALGRIPLPVPGGYRTVCDVRDVARAHVTAAERGGRGEHYILGGESLTVKQLFSSIGRAVGGAREYVEVPDALISTLGRAMDALSDFTDRRPLLSHEMAIQSTFRVRLSSAKARRELGYESRDLDSSLADAVAWYRSSGMLP